MPTDNLKSKKDLTDEEVELIDELVWEKQKMLDRHHELAAKKREIEDEISALYQKGLEFNYYSIAEKVGCRWSVVKRRAEYLRSLF